MKFKRLVLPLILLLAGLILTNVFFACNAYAETSRRFTAEDCKIPDLGLDLNKNSPMFTSANGWDAAQIVYGQYGSDDYIRVDLNYYKTEKDLTANMGGYNNVMGYYKGLNVPDIKNTYKWIEYSDGTGPDHKIYYLVRPVSQVNKEYVTGNMAFYYGTSMAVISFNMKGYSDEAAIAAVKAVEAKARELLNRSITTPSSTPTPSPSPTPSPTPEPWWPSWLTTNSTFYQSPDLSTITMMNGKVEVLKPGSNEWVTADTGTSINPGTKIRTLEDGSASILYQGGHNIKMDSDSMFYMPYAWEVQRVRTLGDLILAYNDGKQINTVSEFVECVKGHFWSWVEKRRTPLYGVITPDAVAGSKGTRYEVIVDDNGTTINVLDGIVLVSGLNQTGVVSVGANQTTTVPHNGVPTPPKAFNWSTVDQWWTKFPAETANVSPAGATPTGSPRASPLIFGFGAVLALAVAGYLKRR